MHVLLLCENISSREHEIDEDSFCHGAIWALEKLGFLCLLVWDAWLVI